jgi:hypothetical protein
VQAECKQRICGIVGRLSVSLSPCLCLSVCERHKSAAGGTTTAPLSRVRTHRALCCTMSDDGAVMKQGIMIKRSQVIVDLPAHIHLDTHPTHTYTPRRVSCMRPLAHAHAHMHVRYPWSVSHRVPLQGKSKMTLHKRMQQRFFVLTPKRLAYYDDVRPVRACVRACV